MLIKVCGIKKENNLKEVVNLNIDMVGLNFYKPSKRYLGQNRLEFARLIPNHINRVGVFVNEEIEKVIEISINYNLDYVQLHGSESPDYCSQMQKHVKVIKALGVSEETKIDSKSKGYEVCDYLLFDTKTKSHGGSGRKFDWKILNTYTGTTPFLLSGGIAPEDYKSIKEIKHPALAGVDINSKFELEPGIKDSIKLSYFINNLKKNGRL